MMDVFQSMVRQIVGMKIEKAANSIGSVILYDFRIEMPEFNFEACWSLIIYNSFWQITKDESVCATAGSDRKDIAAAVRSMVGMTVIAFSISDKAEIEMVVSNGMTLRTEFVPDEERAEDDDMWDIFESNRYVIAQRSSGLIELRAKDRPDKHGIQRGLSRSACKQI